MIERLDAVVAAGHATALARRGLRPVAELAKDRPHGVRLRYMAGCRCSACRCANTDYEKARAAARKAGDWNGVVDSGRARAHMAILSAQGVGRRTVGDVSGIADTVLSEIVAGRKACIRARTERAILAVTRDAAADHALTAADDTWRRLDELIADGYRKADLAHRLGYKNLSLQFNRQRVTVRNAYEVQRLYEQLKMTDAQQTLAMLDELRDEGFRISQILRRVEEAATRVGAPVPDLKVRGGRIRADAARIVHLVHEELLA